VKRMIARSCESAEGPSPPAFFPLQEFRLKILLLTSLENVLSLPELSYAVMTKKFVVPVCSPVAV
jgi:hypothetical protein